VSRTVLIATLIATLIAIGETPMSGFPEC